MFRNINSKTGDSNAAHGKANDSNNAMPTLSNQGGSLFSSNNVPTRANLFTNSKVANNDPAHGFAIEQKPNTLLSADPRSNGGFQPRQAQSSYATTFVNQAKPGSLFGNGFP